MSYILHCDRFEIVHDFVEWSRVWFLKYIIPTEAVCKFLVLTSLHLAIRIFFDVQLIGSFLKCLLLQD